MDSTEAKGLEKMMQSRVVIAALARNVETKLPSILRQIQRLSNYFKETRIIIAEGDSADDSAKVLNDWVQLDYKRRVLLNTSGLMNAVESSGPFANSPLPREGRLSRARNAIIDYLREHTQPPQQQEDYVLVLDLDVMGFVGEMPCCLSCPRHRLSSQRSCLRWPWRRPNLLACSLTVAS